MFPDDILDDILSGVDDQDDTRERLIEGYGRTTYGIDWQYGRLYKTGVKETPFEKAVKYIMTPRGQVEVYPDYANDLEFDKGYGSLVWTLIGSSITTVEEAEDMLQSICDDAASQQPDDIERITPTDIEVSDGRIFARIIITDTIGEVNTYGLYFAI